MTDRREDLGVKCRRWMPLSWRVRDDYDPDYAAWLNQVNEKRLQILFERETREHPSPDMQSIEALLIEVLHNVKQSPPARSVVLAANGVEWVDTDRRAVIRAGDTGTLRMSLDVDLPYEVTFLARIADVEDEARGRRVTANFVERSQRTVDLYEKLVFIYYRRNQRKDASNDDPD